MNAFNQYTSRTVAGHVNVLGEATNAATVSVWTQDGSFATERHGDYFRAEVTASNSAAPVWLNLTNLAVLNDGANPDLMATNTGHLFVAQTPEALGYDADRNTTNEGRWKLTWDAENRLVQLESQPGAPSASKMKLEFAYDAQGRRIQKIVSTHNGSGYVAQSTNRFVYDGWNLLAVLNPESAVAASFGWGLDLSGTLQGAGGVGGLLWVNDAVTISNAPSTHFAAYDGNGNVAALVNAADGGVSAHYEYGPFGELLRATGPMALANPFRFSTKYQDDETDQLYYGYRFYNPTTGRWPSRDPVEEFGGLNLCGFVDNDPLNFIDMVGLACREAKLSYSKSIPLEGSSVEFGVNVKVKKCDDCCTYIHLDTLGALVGGIKYSDKGSVNAAGFTFSYAAEVALSAGRIERRQSLDLSICPGRITGVGRADLIMLDFGMEASGTLAGKVAFAQMVEFSGGGGIGARAEAKLGLAAKVESSGGRCLDVAILGSANAKFTVNAYFQGKGYIKAGKWKFELWDFNWGYKDKVLGQGGFSDEPIWKHQFCL